MWPDLFQSISASISVRHIMWLRHNHKQEINYCYMNDVDKTTESESETDLENEIRDM